MAISFSYATKPICGYGYTLKYCPHMMQKNEPTNAIMTITAVRPKAYKHLLSEPSWYDSNIGRLTPEINKKNS